MISHDLHLLGVWLFVSHVCLDAMGVQIVLGLIVRGDFPWPAKSKNIVKEVAYNITVSKEAFSLPSQATLSFLNMHMVIAVECILKVVRSYFAQLQLKYQLSAMFG